MSSSSSRSSWYPVSPDCKDEIDAAASQKLGVRRPSAEDFDGASDQSELA